MQPKAEASSLTVNLFIAGDLAQIKQACREYCMDVGLCVTVTPTDYIYTGGEESGAIIGIINYPRFPTTIEKLEEHARQLGEKLMHRCCQTSYTVQGPERSYWFSRRAEDSPGAKVHK